MNALHYVTYYQNYNIYYIIIYKNNTILERKCTL